ncbi:hypothetical protein MTO96_004499 [Rhipicephalus appendiculatus]
MAEGAPFGHHKGVSSLTPVASRGAGGPAGWTQQRGIHWFRSTSSHYYWRQDLRCSTQHSGRGAYELCQPPQSPFAAGGTPGKWQERRLRHAIVLPEEGSSVCQQ